MNRIFLMILLSTMVTFTQPGEYLLAESDVPYINILDMMEECELDIRLITHGNLKGVWLDIVQEDRAFINLDADIKDSILVYIDVYKKWAKKANASKVELTKDIASIPIRVAYILNNRIGAGIANANLIFRFFSAKDTDKTMEIALLIMLRNIESVTNEYHHITIGGMFLSEEQAEELANNIKQIPKLKAEALAKEQAADEFTR